jgi:hypothetical protein
MDQNAIICQQNCALAYQKSVNEALSARIDALSEKITAIADESTQLVTTLGDSFVTLQDEISALQNNPTAETDACQTPVLNLIRYDVSYTRADPTQEVEVGNIYYHNVIITYDKNGDRIWRFVYGGDIRMNKFSTVFQFDPTCEVPNGFNSLPLSVLNFNSSTYEGQQEFFQGTIICNNYGIPISYNKKVLDFTWDPITATFVLKFNVTAIGNNWSQLVNWQTVPKDTDLQTYNPGPYAPNKTNSLFVDIIIRDTTYYYSASTSFYKYFKTVSYCNYGISEYYLTSNSTGQYPGWIDSSGYVWLTSGAGIGVPSQTAPVVNNTLANYMIYNGTLYFIFYDNTQFTTLVNNNYYYRYNFTNVSGDLVTGISTSLTTFTISRGYFQAICNAAPPPPPPPKCFTRETIIAMGDGSQKRIDEIRVGDIVLSGKTLQPVNVLAVENQDYTGPIFGINDKKPFITYEHPLIDPLNDKTHLYFINDRHLMNNNDYKIIEKGTLISVFSENHVSAIPIDNILSVTSTTNVYNIYTSDHTFIANGICVYDGSDIINKDPHVTVIIAYLSDLLGDDYKECLEENFEDYFNKANEKMEAELKQQSIQELLQQTHTKFMSEYHHKQKTVEFVLLHYYDKIKSKLES